MHYGVYLRCSLHSLHCSLDCNPLNSVLSLGVAMCVCVYVFVSICVCEQVCLISTLNGTAWQVLKTVMLWIMLSSKSDPSVSLWFEHESVVWVWDYGSSMRLQFQHGTVVQACDCGLSVGLWFKHGTVVHGLDGSSSSRLWFMGWTAVWKLGCSLSLGPSCVFWVPLAVHLDICYSTNEAYKN